MFARHKLLTSLWVLAVVLLPLRVAHAHLHLCLDGNEALVSLHTQDAPTQAGAEHLDGCDDDRDVDVSAKVAPGKTSPNDCPTLALCGVSVVMPPLAAAPCDTPRESAFRRPTFLSFELRPPPRGPPAASLCS